MSLLKIAHWKKKSSHFELKSWVTGSNKIRLGIPCNWRIFESNWLDIESQFDSNILQLHGIQGRILVPPMIQLFRSKSLHFFPVLEQLYIRHSSWALKMLALIHDFSPLFRCKQQFIGWWLVYNYQDALNPLLPSVPYMRHSAKILISINFRWDHQNMSEKRRKELRQ